MVKAILKNELLQKNLGWLLTLVILEQAVICFVKIVV